MPPIAAETGRYLQKDGKSSTFREAIRELYRKRDLIRYPRKEWSLMIGGKHTPAYDTIYQAEAMVLPHFRDANPDKYGPRDPLKQIAVWNTNILNKYYVSFWGSTPEVRPLETDWLQSLGLDFVNVRRGPKCLQVFFYIKLEGKSVGPIALEHDMTAHDELWNWGTTPTYDLETVPQRGEYRAGEIIAALCLLRPRTLEAALAHGLVCGPVISRTIDVRYAAVPSPLSSFEQTANISPTAYLKVTSPTNLLIGQKAPAILAWK